MTTLNTEPNMAAPDDFYERSDRAAPRSLGRRERARQRETVLLLANHIGDPEVLAAAMAAAREDVGAPESDHEALHPIHPRRRHAQPAGAR